MTPIDPPGCEQCEQPATHRVKILGSQLCTHHYDHVLGAVIAITSLGLLGLLALGLLWVIL